MTEEKQEMEQPRTASVNAWMLASRPRTLPAAVSPVIVGSAIAFDSGKLDPLPAMATLLAALFLQIGSNLANDVYDFERGADTADRVGPLRVTQAGLLTPRQVKTGMWVVFGLATLLGLYLTFHAGWVVILLGLASILAALAYTGGPFPYGYHGLGEFFVFLFFGLVATTGTYYVQTGSVSLQAVAAAVPMGFLTTAILAVNNLRDIPSDTASNKRTLAVRFGDGWARQEYLVLILFAYLSVYLMAMTGISSPWVLLTWLSLPLIFQLGKNVYELRGQQLNILLAQTGQLELVFALLFTLGILLSHVYPIYGF